MVIADEDRVRERRELRHVVIELPDDELGQSEVAEELLQEHLLFNVSVSILGDGEDFSQDSLNHKLGMLSVLIWDKDDPYLSVNLIKPSKDLILCQNRMPSLG